MNMPFILQTILFPKEGLYQPEEMYYHTNGMRNLKGEGLRLRRGDIFATDSYFNAFNADFWREHTTLSKLGLRVQFQGSLRLRVYASTNPDDAKEKCLWEATATHEESQWISLLEEVPITELRGMLTLEVKCLSSEGCVLGGEFYTCDTPEREARIAMVVCTFKRERYILANVAQWRKDLFERPEWESRMELYLVDNGGTLKDFACRGVHLFQNANSGGAGGFTRGMMEALKGDFSHILLMDDDLTLHSGVLKRGWALCSFLKEGRCLSAAMLNYDERMCMQHERGAVLVEDAPGRGMNVPLGTGVDTRTFASAFWEAPGGFVYGAWWWFCVPTAAWRENALGYAFPFFVRGDDIEFNLRLARAGYRVLFPSGFAVWHEPFFQKYSPAMEYLIVRNQLILSAIHHLSYGATGVWARHLAQLIFSCHYETAEVTLAAIRDFLVGPKVISENGPLHPLTFSRFIQEERTHPLSSKTITAKRCQLTPEGRFRKVVRVLSLNGLLLPYARREVAAFLSETRGPHVRDAYRSRRITFVRVAANDYYTVTSNRAKALTLLFRTGWLLIRLRLERKVAAKQWCAAAPSLEGAEFWRDYLKGATPSA